MGEIKEVNDDIDDDKLLFIGSNKERFNFNTFNKPSHFISSIYNGEISLEEAEFNQRDLEKRLQNLRGYRNNVEKEKKEEINKVTMKANDMLEYRNKIIEAFRDDTFSFEDLKKSNDAAYDYVLKDANKFIQEIKLMEEKINLSLFEDFFGSLSPADYARNLLILKIQMKTKKL